MTSLTHCSVLAMTLVALPALASGDGDGCGFWLTDCPLPTYPLYLNENDAQGNLLMLLGMPSITLPFTLPADPLNERSQPLFSSPPPQPGGGGRDPKARAALAAGWPPTTRLSPLLEALRGPTTPLYGHAISNSLSSVSAFLDALEAERGARPGARTSLLRSRLLILGQQESPAPRPK